MKKAMLLSASILLVTALTQCSPAATDYGATADVIDASAISESSHSVTSCVQGTKEYALGEC